MTKTELDQTIEAILKRGDPKYTTPSGAFFEVLRGFAHEQKIETFAAAIHVYTSAFPDVGPFIQTWVPGILVNSYFPIRKDLNYEKFVRWTLKNRTRLPSLSDDCSNPVALRQAVDAIVKDVAAWDS